MRARVGIPGFEQNGELLLDGDSQLEGVDRVEPQPVAEQRGFGVDVLGAQVFEVERLDDHLFDLVFQVVQIRHGQ